MLDTWLNRYCRWLSALMVACLVLMVTMVFGNVVMRYGFNAGITMSEELSRWLFLWVIFMGATVAVRERSHMGVDIVVALLPPIGQRLCLLLGHGLMLFVTWLMLDGSVTQTRINWDVEAPVTGLPMAVAYSAGVLFAASTALMLLVDMVKVTTGQLTLAAMSPPAETVSSQPGLTAHNSPKP